MIALHPQYITDTVGTQLVILPKSEFDSIIEELEDLEDIRLYDLSKMDKEPAIPMQDAIKMIED